MTIPHPGLSPSALAGNGRYARAFPCRPVHSQPHLLGDLKWFEPKTIYPLIAVRDREER